MNLDPKTTLSFDTLTRLTEEATAILAGFGVEVDNTFLLTVGSLYFPTTGGRLTIASEVVPRGTPKRFRAIKALLDYLSEEYEKATGETYAAGLERVLARAARVEVAPGIEQVIL